VSFGDFAIFRMDELVEGRFNGGFARAATVHSNALLFIVSIKGRIKLALTNDRLHLQISAAEFASAQPDPVAGFSAPIAKHM
jgi:hypothetical protein